MKKIFIKHKIALIFFGIFLSIVTGSKQGFDKEITLEPGSEISKTAVNTDRRDGNIWAQLGWHYMNNSNSNQAERVFKKTLEINSQNYSAYEGLGLVYFHKKNFLQAEAMLKKAIDINIFNEKLYLELGSFYLWQNKFAQAIEMYKKAIEIKPSYSEPYAALAVVYEEMGNYNAAGECRNKADKLNQEYYNPTTRRNYQKLKEILDTKGIKFVCAQYPMRSIEPLKRLFKGQEGVIFVDNEKTFKETAKINGYEEYFVDRFAGDFGHCNRRGNEILAGNIVDVILKECFDRYKK